MVNGIKAAAAGMMAQQLNIDVIANNLANVNTPGFKEFVPVFKDISERILNEKSNNGIDSQNKAIGSLSAGSTLDATILNFKQGSIEKTDNKLDFAIQGQGFFAVQTPGGVAYTRNGSFMVNEQGVLTTKDGLPVLDENNTPLNVTAGNTNTQVSLNKLNVAEDGKIFLGKQPVGTLKIVEFENPTALTPTGNALYKNETNATEQPSTSRICQGYIEGSNANVIGSMINTIAATRTYESLAKVVKTSEETLSKAVNDVGRLRE